MTPVKKSQDFYRIEYATQYGVTLIGNDGSRVHTEMTTGRGDLLELVDVYHSAERALVRCALNADVRRRMQAAEDDRQEAIEYCECVISFWLSGNPGANPHGSDPYCTDPPVPDHVWLIAAGAFNASASAGSDSYGIATRWASASDLLRSGWSP